MAGTIRWRWDQGRLEYFQFDHIGKIARTLVGLQEVDLNEKTDPLWPTMPDAIGLPFVPHNDFYPVWRNYARVFGCALLATKRTADGRLAVTELCRRLADPGEDPLSVDEYLAFLMQRFYLPSPVFQGYSPTGERVYPFCAALRYLLANADEAGVAELRLSDVFSKLVGNGCSGMEALSVYRSLAASNYAASAAEQRHVREMLIVFSQFNFLKWAGDTLYLDLESPSPALITQLEGLATPVEGERKPSRPEELLALGSLADMGDLGASLPSRELPMDIVFTEGKKVRVTHLRTERSHRLRRLFFASLPTPYTCNMCEADLQMRYPWTENILEVHHLLPLGSPIRLEETGTSLADLVGLCPNCHRSVHRYYQGWLRENNQADFESYDEARSVYGETTTKVMLE